MAAETPDNNDLPLTRKDLAELLGRWSPALAELAKEPNIHFEAKTHSRSVGWRHGGGPTSPALTLDRRDDAFSEMSRCRGGQIVIYIGNDDA